MGRAGRVTGRPNAVILAAGYGTRLGDAAGGWPKPLVPVAGRPFLDHIIERILVPMEPASVLVVVNARDHPRFRRWRDEGGDRGLDSLRLLSDGTRAPAQRLGAVGDLALAVDAFPEGRDLFVLAADTLFDVPVAAMRRRLEQDPRAVVVVPVLGEEDAAVLRRRGVATVDSDGRVTTFEEKPWQPRSDLTVPPVYLLHRQALPLVRRVLDEGRDPDALGGFLEWLVPRKRVLAQQAPGERLDIGTPRGLAEARRALGADGP